MCGFCGWIGYSNNIEDRNKVLINMCDRITTRGICEKEYYQDNIVNLGYNNLMKVEGSVKQPMTKICNGKKYVITYNGEIYNKRELKDEIILNGIHIENDAESEIVLSSYILWKEECVKHLRGIFAFVIWDMDNNYMFLCRDRLGIKPLFYSTINNTLVFGTEIKCLFEYPDINAVIDKEGISQLFGLGPARVEGKCVFKNIYEIKPASYMIYNNICMKQVKYWDLESKEHIDDLDKTIFNVKEKLNDAIISQLSEDMPGSMLSGGLDSSIITAVTSKEYEKKDKKLQTFSVDYIDNDKNFKPNDFQPDSDNKYIEIMREKYDLEHTKIELDTNLLIKGLHEAVIGRDLPGMTDVDVSLLEFCRQIKNSVSTVLSGEFADELFGGYPWFYKQECLDSDTFPWSISVDTRQRILNKRYDIDLKKYVDEQYIELEKKIPVCDSDSIQDKKIKKLMYMNIHQFGATLIDRTDRMSMLAGLNVRVPFTDYRLVEYVWNIPWSMKTHMDREKGLLRTAYKDILPEEVAFRKKSPYPKTCNPNYENALKEILLGILNDNENPLLKLINKNEVLDIIDNLEEVFKRPWFGQLMTGPQFMAYLIQINMWLIEYNVKIEE